MDHSEVPATDDELWNAQYAVFKMLMGFAWEPALRVALNEDGAPERCTRRDCRKAGSCRLKVIDGKIPVCGGTLTGEVLDVAGRMAQFGCWMAVKLMLDLADATPSQHSSDRARPCP